MSDLTVFRNWCRKQADLCAARKQVIPEFNKHGALWTLLADEVDAYLAGELGIEPTPDDVPLEGM